MPHTAGEQMDMRHDFFHQALHAAARFSIGCTRGDEMGIVAALAQRIGEFAQDASRLRTESRTKLIEQKDSHAGTIMLGGKAGKLRPGSRRSAKPDASGFLP